MRKKLKLSIGAVAVALFVLLAVNLVMASTLGVAPSKMTAVSETNMGIVEEETGVVISAEQAEDEAMLKELAPATLEEAESSIYPVRTRFLMWTSDGVHIMWGVYGNGRFVGTDNLGKRCWGIYGRGVFAGFYDGEFFWGKYENGAWKAEYLFGLANSYGKYVTFPTPVIASPDTGNAAP
jgi:hypothetical protein